MFQVWMKNCLVSRAYCFRKLYVYIEDWIKFAFVQTVFCFSHFIFVPCLPVLAIIRSSIFSGQKIEHWTSSDQRHFCATFFLTWPVWRTASQIISSCLTAKNKFSYFKLKYQIFFIYLPKNKKNRKHILNRFEDIVLSVTGFDTNHVSRMIQIFVSWGN